LLPATATSTSSQDGEKEKDDERKHLTLQFSKAATVQNLINKVAEHVKENLPTQWVFAENDNVVCTTDDAAKRLADCLPGDTDHVLTIGDPSEGISFISIH